MKVTEQGHYNILMSNKAAEYHENERQRVSMFNKRKRAAAVAVWPNNHPQAAADPGEGGDDPQADEKVDTAEEKSHLWYVKKYVNFFCNF